MKSVLVIIFVLVGILFFWASFMYFTTPANQLAHFLPGYASSLTKIHTTHALASLVLGLGAFILAWFSLGKKSSNKK